MISAALLLSLGLVACGGGGGGGGSDSASTSPGADSGASPDNAESPLLPGADQGDPLDDIPAETPGSDIESDPISDPPGENTAPLPDAVPTPDAEPDQPPGQASTPPPGADEVSCVGRPMARLAFESSIDSLPGGVLAARIAALESEVAARPICLQLHADASLFDAEDSLRALASGELELAIVTMNQLADTLPEYALFDLPFLFEDDAALSRFQGGSDGQDMLRLSAREGLLPLGFANAGLAQMSANRPIVAPGDMRNLKVVGRDSALFRRQYDALGAAPLAVAFAERFVALLTGVVDAQESSWAVADAQRYAEVQPFFLETHHRVHGVVLVASAAWWDALDPEDRRRLNEIFAQALAETNVDARAADLAARTTVRDADSDIRVLSDDERAAWVEAMQPVWQAVEDTIGVDLINQAVAANRSGSGTPVASSPPDESTPAEGPTAPELLHPSTALVFEAMESLLRVLGSGPPVLGPGDARLTDVEGVLDAAFEFETVVQLVVGANWRDATTAQQSRIVDGFGEQFARDFANRLAPYAAGTLNVGPFVRQPRDDRARVRATFDALERPDLTIDYSLRERDSWRIFDVEIDGISAVGRYRDAFEPTLESSGIAGLIAELDRLNASGEFVN